MRITELWRYPVKSMQGERLLSADVDATGVRGDRRWALVAPDGKVVSAKNPRKWGDVLRYQARVVDGDNVEIAGPDGLVIRSDDTDADAALSSSLGTDVRLLSTPPESAQYEMLFPDIDGLAPAQVIADSRISDDVDGTLTAQMLAFAAPGTFNDIAPLHIVTTATLQRAGADVRRLRPNVVVETEDAGYAENDWSGMTIALGENARALALLATMRCVMTTLPQPGLPRDRGVLQTLARDNRVDIPGLGTWACAGSYCTVAAPGPVAVGDDAQVLSP